MPLNMDLIKAKYPYAMFLRINSFFLGCRSSGDDFSCLSCDSVQCTEVWDK